MTRNESSGEASESLNDILAQLKEATAHLGPSDRANVLQHVLAAGAQMRVESFEPTPPPSRRRPRRPDVVTCRVRVDLVGTTPPLWRRLELASDLFLDHLHDVIQVAFGWTDSHLHRFSAGPEVYGHNTEHYLCPWDVDEREIGIPEHEVRLDEVLVNVGDKLFYLYDYGDDWQHVIKLEAVLPRKDSDTRAVCTKGRRPAPPEDCGGVHGYERIVAATDPTDPEHAAEFSLFYGHDVDPTLLSPTPFDIDEINRALADR